MIYLYGNGNSGNHGCEALSRTLKEIFEKDVCEYAVNASDPQYMVSELKQRELEKSFVEYSVFERIIYRMAYKLKMHRIYNYIRYGNLIKKVGKKDICLSIGGDNYCYGDITWLKSLNYLLSLRAKTVLMGNSIEPELIEQRDVLKDLRKYSLIVARESLTYEALCKNGLKNKAILYPDTAFVLKTEECELPEIFKKYHMVGINISPTIMEAGETGEKVFQAYENIVEYILEKTDMGVALIPHVVWERSDDRIPLKKLYERFKESSKVVLVEDHNCQQMKFIISKCRFFVAARTHASIAAYSTYVPTLVVGYSIKAKGIAKDIFGDWKNYVVPAEQLKNKEDLKKSFQWIMDNEKDIQKNLCGFMPEYSSKVWEIKEKILSLSED